MKTFIILISLVFSNAFAGEKYFLVDQAHKEILKSIKSIPVVENKDLALLKLSQAQAEELAGKLHDEKHVCGGLINVTEEVQAEGDLKSLLKEVVKQEIPNLIPQKLGDATSEVNKLIGNLSPSEFNAELTRLASFPDRYAGGENGKKAALYLKEQAETFAAQHARTDVTVELVPTGGWYIQDSVLVKIAGKDSTLPAVVIGGHFDTYNNQKPGADDDGTGSASIMEIFKSIMRSGAKFNRDVYVAFYAAEEWGLHGSKKIVELFQRKNLKVRSALQFDMTGFKSPNDTKTIYFVEDHVDPQLTKLTKELATKYLGIPADMIGTTLCNYACSDHASWHRVGVPAVFPFEASFQNYNRSIHTGEDSIPKLDLERAFLFVRLGAAFVGEMAELNAISN